MPTSRSDRRKYLRIEVIAPVRFRMIEETTLMSRTDWISGSIINVSEGGMKVTAPIPHSKVDLFLDMHVNIECIFQLPSTPSAIAATAAIAYFMPGSMTDSTTAVSFGLSFLKLDDIAKKNITAFIRYQRASQSSSSESDRD